jgi:hypothetical protein
LIEIVGRNPLAVCALGNAHEGPVGRDPTPDYLRGLEIPHFDVPLVSLSDGRKDPHAVWAYCQTILKSLGSRGSGESITGSKLPKRWGCTIITAQFPFGATFPFIDCEQFIEVVAIA